MHDVHATSSISKTNMFASNIRAQLTPSSQLPKLTGDQLAVLEENFKQNRNPNYLEISLISAEAGISVSEVKVWYQHRLALWRQRQGLPANSGYVNE